MTAPRSALLLVALLAVLALGGVAVAGLGREAAVLPLAVLSVAGLWWLGRFRIED